MSLAFRIVVLCSLAVLGVFAEQQEQKGRASTLTADAEASEENRVVCWRFVLRVAYLLT